MTIRPSVSVCLTKYDPLGAALLAIRKQLVRKSALADIWISVGLGILFFGTVALASLFEGTFIVSYEVKITFVKDIAAPINFALLTPLAIVLIAKLYDRMSWILNSPDTYLSVDSDRKEEVLRITRDLYEHKSILMGTVMIGFGSIAAVTLFYASRHSLEPSYFIFSNRILSVAGLLSFIWATLITYYIAILGLKATLMVVALRRMFNQHPVRYEATHPDRHAGQGEVGEFLVHLNWTMVMIGFTVAVLAISDMVNLQFITTFRTMAAIATYVSVVPSLVLVPTFVVHHRMADAKYALLAELNANTRSDDAGSILNFTQVAKELPEWPSSPGIVPRVVLSNLLPVVATLLIQAVI